MTTDTKPSNVIPITAAKDIQARRWLREYDKALAEAMRIDRLHPYKPNPQRDPR